MRHVVKEIRFSLCYLYPPQRPRENKPSTTWTEADCLHAKATTQGRSVRRHSLPRGKIEIARRGHHLRRKRYGIKAGTTWNRASDCLARKVLGRAGRTDGMHCFQASAEMVYGDEWRGETLHTGPASISLGFDVCEARGWVGHRERQCPGRGWE